ncbi:hypothetical protein DVH05_027926 [Phytophthora capsici]|nr:hypothetical protein DVH05_027926 [Phytophthora capsici]
MIPETAQTDEPAPRIRRPPLSPRATWLRTSLRLAVDNTLQHPYALQQLPIRLPMGSRSLRSIRRLLHGNVDLSHRAQ